MEKINLVELLKDCPKGMELDCTLFEGLEFDSIVDNEHLPIRCRIKHPDGGYHVYNFTKYGYWIDDLFSKCVIFPKGQTTWEGFVPPCQFKDGDVLYVDANNDDDEDDCFKYTFILKVMDGRKVIAHCYMTAEDYFKPREVYLTDDRYPIRFATETEKQKLFQAIEENGYKWDNESKVLKKLIKPKFKVGDKIKKKNSVCAPIQITQVSDEIYCSKINNSVGIFSVAEQDDWELVPDKFDITTLKPFGKVLVRCSSLEKWRIQFFEKYDKTYQSPFICIGCNKYNQCIPYNDNEHLLDTADECDEFYKTWE